MKFRLDSQHYIHDRLLEPGHIVGDQTDVPLVNARGEPIPPTVNMTPLDDEAWRVFKDHYPGAHMPARDPTAAIPLRGTGDTAKAPPLVQIDKSTGLVQQPGGPVKTVDNVPGGYVEGKDHELKKGLPDSGSPNHPVGQPVIGSLPTTPTPVVPPTPLAQQDPDLATNPGAVKAAQEKAAADKKATDDKAAAAKPAEKK